MKVMVLAGGPDRERPISLASGHQVAMALREAGHEVEVHDVSPADLGVLEMASLGGFDVVFPALHGPWGEGGPLQTQLEAAHLKFVGSQSQAAHLAMDKHQCKQIWQTKGLSTPPWGVCDTSELLACDDPGAMPGGVTLPCVAKPVDEGSSIGVFLCRNMAELKRAGDALAQDHARVMLETMIQGPELTVGVLGDIGLEHPLPMMQIISATSFFDFEAKYQRQDTLHRFELDLPGQVVREVEQLAVAAHRAVGCRHLSRVDLMLDAQQRPWLLEINTMPGFTDHSLLPMMAGRAGISFAALVDSLVRMAVRE